MSALQVSAGTNKCPILGNERNFSYVKKERNTDFNNSERNSERNQIHFMQEKARVLNYVLSDNKPMCMGIKYILS